MADDLLKLNNDINVVIDKALSNQNLLKLLKYDVADIDWVLKQEDIEDVTTILDENLFSNCRIPDVITSTKVLLICDSDNFRFDRDSNFIEGNLVFDILVPNSLYEKNGKNRQIYIANELNNELHLKYVTGIGKLYLSRMYSIPINEKYLGKRLIFEIVHSNSNR